MALTGKIMDFFADKDMTTPAFPRTKIKAISDDDNVGLNVLLDEKVDNSQDGMTNLLATGSMVLNAYQFGNELPSAGTAGRIFFLKVSE